MPKVTNLRQFRKRRQRDEAAQKAAENRVRFGRTPAQKRAEEDRLASEARLHEQHRRETDSETTQQDAPPSDDQS